ncbi:DDE-type integrase/transposase/recombinase [Curtanaerobium respiraculi]|uniref:DDE-type integrase/transposase/recombinase n=1 Tax=Curtanaerobium respiraculi TaxID=2949669 RepID=UPI0024B34537|nr:DDE-type integrase/transposase/recombinase [Curtanaerobium respiraculi]
MIQDSMIDEIQEMKLSGFPLNEVYDDLKRRHRKVPHIKTVRKYYNMDAAPEDNHAKVAKQMAFDVEPFRSAVIEIVAANAGCKMSSVYDVLTERYVDSGEFDKLPGNGQTLRHFIHRLEDEGAISGPADTRRRYDLVDTPPAGEKAQIDFGRQKCEGGPTVHFMNILLWHSRYLWVCAQDHRFSAEEACRAIHRFTCKVGGRPKALVIDQDSVFVTEEILGEVFETQAFKDFLQEQDLGLWVCSKADPESKGAIENTVSYVKSSYFSARALKTIDEVQRTLPAWCDRANRRIHQGTFRIPLVEFTDREKAALRPTLPSVYEAAPLDLKPQGIGSQPYVLYRSVKYSVPWEMCYSAASYRVIGSKLHVYDAKRRHVCVHDISPVKGSFQRLDEHRRQPASDWLDIAERMRAKWSCTDFQHFVNGFKKENQARHLGKQLGAVERYLDEKKPSRALVAEAMRVCCRDFRYRYTQFKAVFDLVEADLAGGGDASVVTVGAVPANDVDSRGLDSYRKAFEERCAS